jgi:arylsulfatase A
LVVRWPGKVRPGSTSHQLAGLVDLMATCAAIVGQKLPDTAGEDSVSLLPIWLDKADRPVRKALVHHSISGKFAIRQGRWKLELCPGSGGWSAPNDRQAARQGSPATQLYDLTDDLGERRNVAAEHPEIVRELSRLLEACVARGRSTPGEPQQNDAAVDLWKPEPSARWP